MRANIPSVPEPEDAAALRDEIARLHGVIETQAADARAEQDRLTFELGHRVKNTLGVVQALASQTLRHAASPQAAMETLNHRILALARANDAILRERWTTASMGVVARSVLQGQGAGYGELTITGADLPIAAGAALSFAIALHELATNARRHGAWSVPDGRVALAWDLVGLPPEQKLVLTWIEEGGPPAEAPARRGFGLRLLEQSLRSAFGRGVATHFEQRGFSCRVVADTGVPATPRMSPAPAPRVWQRMLSGRRLDLIDPAPGDIAIADIAHGLARVARWNGQTAGQDPFSVAQHSLLVETLAAGIAPALTPPERLAALLHDAPEYVIGDLISPFKAVLGDGYKAVERRLLDAIHARFGLPPTPPVLAALIKRADQVAAFFEATQLAGFSAEEAGRYFGQPDPQVAALAGVLAPLRPAAAEAAFLARFRALGGEAG